MVCRRRAYCAAASRLPARRLAVVLARKSRCSVSSCFTCEISRSHSPAWDASPVLYWPICLRRFSCSTSSSASGFCRSRPEIKRLKKPRTRFESLWNIGIHAPFANTDTLKLTLSVPLGTLPACQEIVHHFRLGRFANFLQVHLNAVCSKKFERAVCEFHRDIGIRRTKSVFQRFLLNWLGQ